MTLTLTTAGLVVDNFDRADASTLGGIFTQLTGGSGTFGIGTNRAYAQALAYRTDKSTATYAANQAAQIDLVGHLGDWNGQLGVLIRLAGAWSTENGYMLQNYPDSGGMQIMRLDNGAATTLGTYNGPANMDGRNVEIWAEGSRISIRRDGTEVLYVTDSTYSSGTTGIKAAVPASHWITADNFKTKTRAPIAVTSLPAGYYARLTDGVHFDDAAASAGTATITPTNCTGFGPWTLRIYNGNPTTTGVQQGADQTGVYGGDSWAGSGFGGTQYAAAGTITCTSTASGVAAARRVSAGTCAATSSTVGSVTLRAAVSGVCNAVSGAVGAISRLWVTGGSCEAVSDSSGSVALRASASGRVDIVSGSSAVAAMRAVVAGVCAIASSAFGSAAKLGWDKRAVGTTAWSERATSDAAWTTRPQSPTTWTTRTATAVEWLGKTVDPSTWTKR